jgi:hypothetical protein
MSVTGRCSWTGWLRPCGAGLKPSGWVAVVEHHDEQECRSALERYRQRTPWACCMWVTLRADETPQVLTRRRLTKARSNV